MCLLQSDLSQKWIGALNIISREKAFPSTHSEGRHFQHFHDTTPQSKRGLDPTLKVWARFIFACVELSRFLSPAKEEHLPFNGPKSQQIHRNDVSDKEGKRTSPGRAVRGKLVNMVLYCTHDICFSFFLFFFFFLIWCEQQKLALHGLQP